MGGCGRLGVLVVDLGLFVRGADTDHTIDGTHPVRPSVTQTRTYTTNNNNNR